MRRENRREKIKKKQTHIVGNENVTNARALALENTIIVTFRANTHTQTHNVTRRPKKMKMLRKFIIYVTFCKKYLNEETKKKQEVIVFKLPTID